MNLKNIFFLIPAIGMFFSCGSKENNKVAINNNSEAIAVKVAKAGQSANGAMISVSGQLASEHSAAVSTRMMGYITKMNVKIGDNVRAGQLLFSVQSADIQAKSGQVSANIAAADAALANAKKDYERFKILHQQNSATDKELENMALQYKAAESQAQAAKQMRNEVNANMAYANVTAPFSGTITQKLMDAGNLASPGMPVVMLESTGALQAVATVTEEQIKYIRNGIAVLLTTDAGSKTVTGTISQVSRSSVGTGGQYLVKINLASEKDLLSGMYVHINIPVNDNSNSNISQNVWIPEESLVKQGDLTGIYTIGDKNTAILRWLRIGKSSGAQVEVLSGLAVGEAYISSATSRLWNGATVKF
ncbi:MAG: efflux RND transporter periplasmic adaptor subunit [Chitinophagaceae bacterium]|nr:efflux RND transporter periplasmic adaptor subunit [Chitinophagaceae bacterium]